MIQPPEWTGYLPAAVSALHALGVLLRRCRGRFPAEGPPRAPAADGPLGRGRGRGCRCAAGRREVRVATGGPAGVPVHVVVTVTALPGGPAGEERGPW
ncbi:hypothetical protein MUU72_30490 [Streptomyces sp. RS10V-4]|uniref:hypothetical protein n=1 Tax=Streptomyces rhizoryzae TaxID=2932493 RepID=UPI002004550E|nr:hypothetical protein [Streptomyces rhizoryzae]MCK7627373.1 hypothetical protein [Streptomyces rhizoryzae]